MKKALIGMVAGAAALTSALAPAPVSAASSIWGNIADNSDTEVLEDLILIAGLSGMLSNCSSNNAPKYTMFAPNDIVFLGYDDSSGDAVDNDVEGLFDALGTSVSGLSKAPAVVAGILNDHIVNGLFSPDVLDADTVSSGNDQSIKKITARSGYVLSIVNDDGMVASVRGYGNIYVDGNLVSLDGGDESCNGWVYYFDGFIDSSSNALHEGTNVQDAPNDGTPGGTNSLPDTL